MSNASDAFREGLRRFLSESGFTWVERLGPPPPGVKILKSAHPPSVAERLCEEGFPLVYIVAVRRRDSSTPLEEACHRGEVCYVYGDVEWAPELLNRCRPVTFYVDIKEERKALEALLLYIARTRGLPWLSFNRDVLRIVGLCDVDVNICLAEEAILKKVEAMKKQLATPRPYPTQPSEPQIAAGSDAVGDAPNVTAQTQGEEPPAPAQDDGKAAPTEPRLQLDPAVLELLRRCCGVDCISRLVACRG